MNNETATDASAQDTTNRIEEALYGAPEQPEATNDIATEDDANLPEDDDIDLEEDAGSEDELETANEEELSLAGYLGLDEDRLSVKDDGSVVFNAIIDGENKEVALKDLTSSYQLQGHVNNKSIALENERKEFSAQRNAVTEHLKQQLDQATAMTEAAGEQLMADYNSIDWDRLRAEQPSEWSALRQEFAEKANSIQSMKDNVMGNQTKLQEQHQQEQNQQRQAFMQEQVGFMVRDNPTWSDPEVLKTETGKIKSFLQKDYGFNSDDLAVITDHRAIKLIQDAMAYRNGKAGAEAKIAKPVPKFQKPGQSRGNAKSLQKARDAKSLKAKAKQTGSTEDVANLLLNRM